MTFDGAQLKTAADALVKLGEAIEGTTEAFAAAFALWEKKYQEEPEFFDEDHGTPTEYGDRAAHYFEKILKEIAGP